MMTTDQIGLITFRLDPLLSSELKKLLETIILENKGSKLIELREWAPSESGRVIVDFVSESSLHLVRTGDHLKICVLDRNQGLFSFGQNLDSSAVDVILDEDIDFAQIERLVSPKLKKLQEAKEGLLFKTGIKNLKKVESSARLISQKVSGGELQLTSDSLLSYAQDLVSLEKDLIHADGLVQMEKVLKQFAKNKLNKASLRFFANHEVENLAISKNFLVLPRYKGDFLAIEMSWEVEDNFQTIKRVFFLYTLITFFSSQQDLQDPFFAEKLWEEVLDSVPFPVALLSQKGDVYQHNTLFANLNYPIVDCLHLKLREKILINNIPYNIFRKDLFHLDESKILFVFFTESFFLKGDGNLTPTGQELGIISSSIAHELNNPIAGIQAALSVLMLDETMNEEALSIIKEMKNGAFRCKQLIETFLGFSRANPRNLDTIDAQLSPIEVCYSQAQNLLRFRTVESGIRFSFDYSKHSPFRASVNLSLLTMTFYLILGELMTLYSHQMLVANKNQIEKVIRGELIESSHEIQIQMLELNIATLSLSKLVQNLLTIENFVLQVSDYSLRFIYTPPKDV